MTKAYRCSLRVVSIIYVLLVIFPFWNHAIAGWERANPLPLATNLNDVWGSSGNDVFVAGSQGILHYDGVTWSYMENGTSNGFGTIWGLSGNDVFAVGSTIQHYQCVPL